MSIKTNSRRLATYFLYSCIAFSVPATSKAAAHADFDLWKEVESRKRECVTVFRNIAFTKNSPYLLWEDSPESKAYRSKVALNSEYVQRLSFYIQSGEHGLLNGHLRKATTGFTNSYEEALKGNYQVGFERVSANQISTDRLNAITGEIDDLFRRLSESDVTLPKGLRLFRIEAWPSQLKMPTKGNTFIDPGFVSTTTDPNYIKQFAAEEAERAVYNLNANSKVALAPPTIVVTEIRVNKKGVAAAYIPELLPLDGLAQEEAEMLLPRNCRFKITETRPISRLGKLPVVYRKVDLI